MAENVEIFKAGNFSYASQEEALEAEKEQDRIDKLERQMDYNRPEVVLSLYQKILLGNVFHTPQGILYLVHLQEYLKSCQDRLGGEIPLIPADLLSGPASPEKESTGVPAPEDPKKESAALKRMKKTQKKLEDQVFVSRIVIIFLAAAVVAMLIIAGTGNSPTILNYKKQVQNEYVEWQQQLEEKEAQLREKEKQLEQ